MKKSIPSEAQEVLLRQQAYEAARKVRKKAKLNLRTAQDLYKEALAAEKEQKRQLKALVKVLASLETNYLVSEDLQEETTTVIMELPEPPTAMYLVSEMEPPEPPKVRKGGKKEKALAVEAGASEAGLSVEEAPVKRGRPRKSAAVEETAAETAAEAPVKRGRPRKSAAVVESAVETAAEAPVKRGRPRKSEAVVESAVETAAEVPVKRGRPRKSAAESSVEVPVKRSRARKSAAGESETAAEPAAEAPVKRSRQKKAEAVQPALEETVETPAVPVDVPVALENEEAASGNGDDLTKISGVGVKVLEALHNSGIYTFAEMANTTEERFREILAENNMNRKRDTSKWAETAASLMNAE